MDERHLYFAALVASPWLAIGGTALAGCGLLLCGDPGQVLAGAATLTSSALAGELAWEQIRKAALPARP